VSVSTSVPRGHSSAIVAEVNARSVMSSVQFSLGRSDAAGIAVTGGSVSAENGV
jgi:hypothetical protein